MNTTDWIEQEIERTQKLLSALETVRDCVLGDGAAPSPPRAAPKSRSKGAAVGSAPAFTGRAVGALKRKIAEHLAANGPGTVLTIASALERPIEHVKKAIEDRLWFAVEASGKVRQLKTE